MPQPAIRWHPIYIAALYGLSIFLMLYVVMSSIHRVNDLTLKMQDKEAIVERLKPFSEAYTQAEQSTKSLEDLKRLFVYLDQHYVDWPLFFHRLEPNLPKDIWLTAVGSSAVTTAPTAKKKEKVAPTLAGESPEEAAEKAKQEESSKAKATAAAAKKAGTTAEGVPLHTGEIIIEGMVNGYALTPIHDLIKNLQEDPYFIDPYMVESALEEQEEGVVRTFKLVVRVKKYQPSSDTGESEASSDNAAKPAAAQGGDSK